MVCIEVVSCIRVFISATGPEEFKEVNQGAEVTPGAEVAPIYGN